LKLRGLARRRDESPQRRLERCLRPRIGHAESFLAADGYGVCSAHGSSSCAAITGYTASNAAETSGLRPAPPVRDSHRATSADCTFMGLRFRTSFPLRKRFRFTLSKSGVSVGIGFRAMNVNFGPRGVRSTVGIPGTGVSYQEEKGWPKTTTPRTPTPITEGPQRDGAPWLLVVMVVFTEKTRIVHINEGIDFRGCDFRTYSEKLLINPSKKSAQASYDTLRKAIGDHLMVKQEELIRL
jgi:hypothetical protein